MHTFTGGGGVTCLDLGNGRTAGVPRPHPIHILVYVKNMTYPYTYYSENGTYSYIIFLNFTYSYTFE